MVNIHEGNNGVQNTGIISVLFDNSYSKRHSER